MALRLSGGERFRRGPVNFLSKGYYDWHLLGIGRAAKMSFEPALVFFIVSLSDSVSIQAEFNMSKHHHHHAMVDLSDSTAT